MVNNPFNLQYLKNALSNHMKIINHQHMPLIFPISLPPSHATHPIRSPWGWVGTRSCKSQRLSNQTELRCVIVAETLTPLPNHTLQYFFTAFPNTSNSLATIHSFFTYCHHILSLLQPFPIILPVNILYFPSVTRFTFLV